jgi:hypothetical protein
MTVAAWLVPHAAPFPSNRMRIVDFDGAWREGGRQDRLVAQGRMC